MHFSRMRTALSSSHPGGCLHQAPPRDQALPREQTPRDQAPPTVDRITDACENITLPQLRWGR